ncbi:Predicted ferric reductase [Geodermatophilus saharensis]|uniref:Predicted ferric reductase n=1 Tax=Geodermatophilus saharensis TaxID=1137994 RepID=A0A239BU63_9ACTN|nr:ferredoxin reductase family protein [Geodermatophilus saharensis]SNS10594.1 Predicted ferric reductase [Geodermatophilus saharensis]
MSTAVATPSPGTVLTVPEEDRRARTDAAVRTVATVLLWAGLALVTWWWASGGGVADLTAWDTGLTSLGRLTGLLASDLLLVQVLLMSRLPVLERAFGQDRLVRLHRVTGLTSFDLLVGHVVLVTWGYAAGELSRTPATLWELTTQYPGMLLAVAGTACLVLVVVTSVRAARRRLRYQSWHLIHLYAYLGVGLALPHQLWTGQEFLSSPAATVYWWSLWTAAAGAVLVWRVALPVVRSARHGLRVTTVVPEGDGVVSVYLSGRHLDRLPVEAGQFLTWRFLAGPGWTRAHPYSLSAAPDGRSLRITVKDSGDGSAAVARLRPGTRALVEGPHGRLSARARTRRRVLLVGAGVGVAPLRALAEALPYAPGEAALLYRHTGRPLFERELAVLARERGLQVLLLPGHRRSPDSWLGEGVPPVPDAAVLAAWVPDLADRDVYVCGPEGWAAGVRRSAEAAGLPAGRCHVESFGW